MSKKKKLSKHIHKFERKDIARKAGTPPYVVMICRQPGCTTYYTLAFALGKIAECWVCGDPFVIDKVSITHTKPHCSDCIKRKVKPIIAELSDIVKDI